MRPGLAACQVIIIASSKLGEKCVNIERKLKLLLKLSMQFSKESRQRRHRLIKVADRGRAVLGRASDAPSREVLTTPAMGSQRRQRQSQAKAVQALIYVWGRGAGGHAGYRPAPRVAPPRHRGTPASGSRPQP